jgi:hypothetical protein
MRCQSTQAENRSASSHGHPAAPRRVPADLPDDGRFSVTVGYAGDQVVRLLQRICSPAKRAAMKCLYLALMSLDPTGTGRQRWATGG